MDSDAILVGCVKTKLDHAAPARELYVSQLARQRREYAEAQGKPWFIASAEYGLVRPDQVIEPYDTSIEDFDRAERARWAAHVAQQLQSQLGSLDGKWIELHAGGSYKTHLRNALRARGANVRMLVHEGEARGMTSIRRWYDNAKKGTSKWDVALAALEARRSPGDERLTPQEWQARRKAARKHPRDRRFVSRSTRV